MEYIDESLQRAQSCAPVLLKKILAPSLPNVKVRTSRVLAPVPAGDCPGKLFFNYLNSPYVVELYLSLSADQCKTFAAANVLVHISRYSFGRGHAGEEKIGSSAEVLSADNRPSVTWSQSQSFRRRKWRAQLRWKWMFSHCSTCCS